MQSIPDFTPYQAKIIRHFFDNPLRSSKTWSYPKAAGFLFAVACEPEMIRPEEWIELILGGDGERPLSDDETESIIEALLSLFNWAQAGIGEGKAALPPGCSIHADAMANFDPASDLSQWSQGFMWGNDWAGSEEWVGLAPESMDNEIGALLMTLSFFSSRKIAEAFHAETSKQAGAPSFDEMAGVMSTLVPGAVEDYGLFAFAVRRAVEEAKADGEPEANEPPVSRNAPCPCGSGKKYKACCGKS